MAQKSTFKERDIQKLKKVNEIIKKEESQPKKKPNQTIKNKPPVRVVKENMWLERSKDGSSNYIPMNKMTTEHLQMALKRSEHKFMIAHNECLKQMAVIGMWEDKMTELVTESIKRGFKIQSLTDTKELDKKGRVKYNVIRNESDYIELLKTYMEIQLFSFILEVPNKYF